MRIGLVACGKSKLAHEAPAKDLYTGQLFRLARGYAEKVCDRWFVLSAQYGLLNPDTRVHPYDLSLAHVTQRERDVWGATVIADLGDAVGNLADHTFVLLAGVLYREPLENYLCGPNATVETPLAGLRIGQQLAWLKHHTPTT